MTKSIKLILMRHGNTFAPPDTPVQVGSRSDLPLVEFGKEQALKASQFFVENNYHFNQIYSGPLKRQQESAEIISRPFKLKPYITSALNEIDYGLWEGKTVEEIKSKWPEDYDKWHNSATWPNQTFKRTLQEHLLLIKNWLTAIWNHHNDQAIILALTSNGIIRLFLYYSNLNWNKLIVENQMSNYKVSTGHFCELTLFKENGLLVNSWNRKPV